MSTEAMKLALEALESCDTGHITDGSRQWYDERLVDKAITALQEVLAQPQQEPVAWMSDCAVGFRKSEFGATPTVPLYTSSPSQRKPLTDEEIWKFWWARPEVPEGENDSMEAQFIAAVRAVEAAHNIKENT